MSAPHLPHFAFVTDATSLANTVNYTYDGTLVMLSVVVAILASYTAFQLIERVIAATNRQVRNIWIAAGAISMGSGIWSMHFVAMLAVQMPLEARYEPFLTALSIVFAVAASGFAIRFIGGGARTLRKLAGAGVVLGAGIGAMHYTGMAAMRMKADISYDPYLFGLSIAVAVVLATFALRLMYLGIDSRGKNTRGRQVLTAVLMGSSIAAMHYTGMAATVFTADEAIQGAGLALSGSFLIEAIVAVTLLILSLSWISVFADRRFRLKELALERSETLLAALANSVSDAFIMTDGNGRLLSLNPAATEIFGYAKSDVNGESLDLLIPGFTGGESHEGEGGVRLDGRHKDGSTLILETSQSRMDLEGKQVFAVIVRDVTVRHEAEQALRKNEAQLRASRQRLDAVMNSVFDAVICFNSDGEIEICNSSVERIFGVSAAASVGKEIWSFLPASDCEALRSGIGDFLESGDPSILGECCEGEGIKADGSAFAMEYVVNWTEEKDDVLFVALCRDITLRRQAEDERLELERELRQAQKMESLGTLSGGIAHEINTPVQYIGDNVRFMQESFAGLHTVFDQMDRVVEAAKAAGAASDEVVNFEKATEEEDIEFLLEEMPTAISQTLEGVGRISEIVQAIKEFSHPDAKEKSLIDINHAINTTITVARNQWKYVADLETDFDESMPPVNCLPGEFNQVVLNLIVNAAHAIADHGDEGNEEAKGKITVSTHQDGEFAVISVADSGTGIKPDVMEKIFDPFFTTKEPGRGTGQGLSISHSIITKKHGGTIDVSSEVGRGTTFTIRLPIEPVAGSEVAAE